MKIRSTQNQPAHLVGGFLCPCCRNRIQFPFQALLLLPSITCPHCGLELQIDAVRSASVLEDLRRYIAGLADAERILEEKVPG